MKRMIVFVLPLLLVGSRLLGQTAEQEQLAANVKMLTTAMVDADKSKLLSLTSSSLSYGHSSGKIQDQAAFVDAIVSGQSDFVTIDITEQTLSLAGPNTAIVRHKFAAKTNDNGVPGTANIGVLQVWQKENGAWRLLARQAFKLP